MPHQPLLPAQQLCISYYVQCLYYTMLCQCAASLGRSVAQANLVGPKVEGLPTLYYIYQIN